MIFDLPKLVFEAALKLMRLQGLTPQQAVARAKQQFPGASGLDTKELERKLEAEAAKDAAKNKTGAAAGTAVPVTAGHYAIRRSDEEYLTLQNGDRTAGTPTVVFAPAGNPAQRWELKVLEAAAGTTTCTLRNLAGGSFLGYEEEPDADVLTGGFPEPVTWALSPGPDARRFTIAVPGADLHLGISLMRAYPPRTGLKESDGQDTAEWELEAL
ncbi:hypothetical protein ACFQ7J_13420 [Streptomyces sp. NPDC056501]|uniref:hypothetical protein n=1 Tax=Streptomyces sp. NPDC056501 TaxID=3345841 RepID=UPI003673AAAD